TCNAHTLLILQVLDHCDFRHLLSFPTRRSSDLLAGGPDLAQRPNLYQPLDQYSDAIRQQAQPLSALSAFNPVEQVQRIISQYPTDRKSTRLNSSHVKISYAVFCLKKKTTYRKSS